MKRLLIVALLASVAGLEVSCGGGGGGGGCTQAEVDAAKKRCERCLDSCSGCADPGAACTSSCRPCDE